LRSARSWARLLCVLFLIPAVSPGVADSGGFLQTGNISESFDADGKRFFYTASTYTLDFHGRIEKALTTTEFSLIDPTTNRETATYTYDKAGDLILIETDGDAGRADSTVHYRYITTFTNLNQYQTVVATSTESVADGTVERFSTETFTFDEQQRLVRDETELDFNYDGTVDSRYVTTWDYDVEDHRTYQLSESDWNDDGVVDFTTQSTYVTDDRGNFLSVKSDDGTGTYSYDKFGNFLQFHFEYIKSNGSISTSTTTSSYSHRGEVIRDSNPGSATRALRRPDSWQLNPTGVRSFQHLY